MSVYTSYSLGITIDGTPIPDPSSFDYTSSSLDVSGERDTTGLLHRDMVAVKHNLSLTYDALDWATVKSMLALMAAESFTLEFPYPEDTYTKSGTYYCGDRSVKMIQMSESSAADYVGQLSVNFIEF